MPPMPAIKDKPDVSDADLGDQVLHLRHRMDKGITSAGPGSLWTDIFQAQTDAVVLAYLRRLAQSRRMLTKVLHIGQLVITRCEPRAYARTTSGSSWMASIGSWRRTCGGTSR